MTLEQLAVHYNTDKAKFCHNYCEVYDTLFRSFKNEVKNVLEIGTSEGASLRMFRDYFVNANIHGIDIVDFNEETSGKLGERVFAHKCDQTSKEQLLALMDKLNVKFDIIVDDGSHDMNDIKISLDVLFPFLKEGGLYLIEDLEHPRRMDEALEGHIHWFAQADSPIMNSNIIVIKK
jgi:cyclopropane fatty-acyl-phospholipid synthase-like methyltransferase